MTDTISCVKTDEFKEQIDIILRQTDYSYEVAKEKLEEYNRDHVAVIKAYMGIGRGDKDKKHVNSINQEIYRQLRNKLDNNLRDYRERVEKGEVKKVI
jgi:molybdopterin synthase catalytic subunit